ncbi:MAG: DUF4872 domain-containing protein [Bacillota bacterium]
MGQIAAQVSGSQEKGHSYASIMARFLSFGTQYIDEAVVFGLTQGVDFKYRKGEQGVPSRVFALAGNLDLDILLAGDVPNTWYGAGEFPWKNIREALRKNQVVLLRVNPQYLVYHGKQNINHSDYLIAAVCYMETDGLLGIIDPQYHGPQYLIVEDLAEAMYRCSAEYRYGYWVVSDRIVEITEQKLRKALYTCAKHMLFDADAYSGISAMHLFAQEMLRWKEEVKDWKWSALYCCSLLLNYGQKSGCRSLYADFLTRAARIIPELDKVRVPQKMQRITLLWDELAANLYAITRTVDNSLIFQTAGVLKKIAVEEERLYSMILSVLSGSAQSGQGKQVVNEN